MSILLTSLSKVIVMIENFFKKALTGVMLGVLFALVFGTVSALLTNDKYLFSSEYSQVGKEKLLASYKHGRTKLQFFAYDAKQKLVISKQFFGYFLRFGSHYLLVATEQDTADKHQLFTVRSFFIKGHGDNAFMISDNRGVFVTKDGNILHLNSIMTGKRHSE